MAITVGENYSGQLTPHADFKNIGNSMFGGAITIIFTKIC